MGVTAQRYAGVIAATFLLALVVSWSPVGRQFDYWTYDLLLRANPPPPRPSRSLLIAIDEESLNAFGGLLAVRKPLARALELLARNKPSAVAVDLVISEPRGSEQDGALAAAVAKIPNIVLATSLRADGDGWEKPIPALAEHAALGHVHAEPDADGVCRRILLAKAAGRERFWAMGLEAYRLSLGVPYVQETERGLELGESFIPASPRRDRELLIRFPNPASPIERISLRELLERPELAARARGRVVFVGVRVLGGIDRYLMTPYSDGVPASGVDINAAVYETLAAGRFLTPLSPLVALVLSAFIAFGVAWLFWRLRAPQPWRLAAPGLLLAGAHLVPPIAFAQQRVAPTAQLIFPAWAVFGVAAGFYYLVLRRNLDQAERQTERYRRAVHYVTHEMRTPLTAIQGSSELISKYNLSDEKRREIGELIHRESRRLGKMVEMFLSVERLSAGQLELKRRRVPLDELLDACLSRLEPLAQRKRIRVTSQIPAGLAAWGDREFLEYACYNLLSNAVKYSPAETAITVRAFEQDSRVLISVEDQGYGMDPAEIPNIFQKFYRASTAAKSGEQGTGLGLAIVEEIVVQHGGSIRVESELGRGSRFTIDLPQDASVATAGGKR